MRGILAGVLLAVSFGGASLAQTSAPQTSAPPAPAPTTWADTITLKGDLRYRDESIVDKSSTNANKNTYTRERHRIRARLTAEAKCNANLKAGIGLSTGQSDPISGNQTLTDAAGKKDMRLDLAYFDYSLFGEKPLEVHALAGKMNNPLITFPDDLLWDGDLRPEGLALRGQLLQGPATFFVNGAYEWLQERKDRGDAVLWAGQAAVKLQFQPEIAVTVGGAYCDYHNIRGLTVIDWEGKGNAYGNSTTGEDLSKAWATDFTPALYCAQVDLWLFGKPLGLYAQGVTNSGADKFDQGHMYGVTIGKAKNPRTWEVNYTYTELQKDATPGMFTDSDRWGGGTDGKGSKFVAKYQIMKNFQAGVSYFVDKKKISDPEKTKDYTRLQVDLVASF
jgi:hypothetical protein